LKPEASAARCPQFLVSLISAWQTRRMSRLINKKQFGQTRIQRQAVIAADKFRNNMNAGKSDSQKRNLGSCLPQAAKEGLPRSTNVV
jgi:hypothetical protein